jgi:hypothetical protein
MTSTTVAKARREARAKKQMQGALEALVLLSIESGKGTAGATPEQMLEVATKHDVSVSDLEGVYFDLIDAHEREASA